MKICVEVAEAAERLEELIDLALRGDEVVACRVGNPVAVIMAVRKADGARSMTFCELHWQPRVARRAMT